MNILHFVYVVVLLLALSACGGYGNCLKRLDAVEKGRRCRRPCRTDANCVAANKKCRCDGTCGMSCYNPNTTCVAPAPIPHGSFTVDNRMQGQANYTCDDGYFLFGTKTTTCSADKKWHPSVPTCKNVDECGHAGKAELVRDSLSRIVGGYDAVRGSWPWFALITRKSTTPKQSLGEDHLKGGGSVIHNYWVLTAAHVLSGEEKSNFYIFVGLSERPSAEEPVEQSAEVYSIARYIEHPKFNELAKYNNDIALIKLGISGGLNFGPKIRAICLPGCSIQNSAVMMPCNTEEELTEGRAIVIGFGHVDASFTARLQTDVNLPKRLKQATLRNVDRMTCSNALDEIETHTGQQYQLNFTENMLCFGSSDGNNIEDACDGDSGGPLMRQVTGPENETSRWVQIGIVSFGYGCSTEYPGFYTDVSKYTSWIGEKILEDAAGCDLPGILNNAHPDTFKSFFVIHEKVKYKCRTGYYMSGDAYRTCQENGWTVAQYTCRLQTCPALSERVYHGSVDFTPGFYFGSMAKLLCDRGYEASDSAKIVTSIICSAGEDDSVYGEWTGELSSCETATCAELEPILHGTYLAHNSMYSVAVYVCDPGYILNGTRTRTCRADKKWHPEAPTCIPTLYDQFENLYPNPELFE